MKAPVFGGICNSAGIIKAALQIPLNEGDSAVDNEVEN